MFPMFLMIIFDSKFSGSNYHERMSSYTSLFAVFDAIVDIAVSWNDYTISLGHPPTGIFLYSELLFFFPVSYFFSLLLKKLLDKISCHFQFKVHYFLFVFEHTTETVLKRSTYNVWKYSFENRKCIEIYMDTYMSLYVFRKQ